MSDDTEDLSAYWPLLPEQYTAFQTALDILNSYMIEPGGFGPGTREQLETAVLDGPGSGQDNAVELAVGLMNVAMALVAMRQMERSEPPYKTIQLLRAAFQTPAD
ncbi:hypothetical protein C6A86_026930 [Mycobacterium sp. ITM-2016-00316]|uniref:hypothetical protein n=1 Tax=Mycobacterium sp. ITM-2016-00316 TaxID=2099695 RepID=UPI001E2986FD|nr:hypothetical protein [Mycobacterium sp. ITM-2016-00316]WNG81747.1 hypothetical protein C6A86_026930 [Mycobacterium sp. ITM-2016-00316]